MAIFNWRAEVGTTGNGEFSVFTSRFGDGYTQDVPNGINNETQKWSVKVSGKGLPGGGQMVQAVLDFIRAQAGSPFQWKHPNMRGALGWYSCKRYSQSDEGGDYWTITMEFEQSYQP